MPSHRVVCAALGVILGAGAAAVPATATTPQGNVGLPVDFWPVCDLGPTSAACTDAVLTDVDYARSLEGVGPMLLPAGFASLDPGRQVFVVTNLERVDRGLRPIVGLTADLATSASAAAVAFTDPVFTGTDVGPLHGVWWTGIWADTPTPLIADLLWMYQDGYSGSDTTNVDCTAAGGTGCWGHRANILSDYGGAAEIVAGTGFAAGDQSVAELAVGGTGALPPLDYTWAQAVQAGAGGPAALAATTLALAPVTRAVDASSQAFTRTVRRHRPRRHAALAHHTRRNQPLRHGTRQRTRAVAR